MRNFNKCKFNRLYQKFPLQDDKDGSKVLQNTEQYQPLTLTSVSLTVYIRLKSGTVLLVVNKM